MEFRSRWEIRFRLVRRYTRGMLERNINVHDQKHNIHLFVCPKADWSSEIHFCTHFLVGFSTSLASYLDST
jgi:hypothetical protein